MFSALVAAILNIEIGNPYECIEGTVEAADLWMAQYGPVGSDVRGDSEAWQTGEPLSMFLDKYNNGELCAPSRDATETGGCAPFWKNMTFPEREAIFTNPPYNWSIWQIGGLPYSVLEPPYWDEYESEKPEILYSIKGTRITTESGEVIQYPAFSFAWSPWHSTQTGPREVFYESLNNGSSGWRYMSWDDGGERCFPSHGYLNVTLVFPEGEWQLALYAYDHEAAATGNKKARDSQEYRIYDVNGGLLDTAEISGTAFVSGVYEIFKVTAPHDGYTIIVQVYNSGTHYPKDSYTNGNYPPDHTINVVLSGIFVDLWE
jgi:hypothetical protein